MKKEIKIVLSLTLIGLLMFPALKVNAGNEDRSGQAGAAELLINPWARGAGWGNVGIANARGVEAMFLNVAGIAFTNKTQVAFMNTQWLKGSGTTVNSFGLTQRVGSTSVLGVSVTSMGFGDIQVTTTENPGDDPNTGIGTFSPSFINVTVSYAKSFSDAIHGGFSVKLINESISDLNATGAAFDAGIQYVTGDYKNIRFGIALKNIGTPMSFGGDGYSIRGLVNGSDNNLTLEQRAAQFELPSLLSIGGSYDFLWAKKTNNIAQDSSNKVKKTKLSYDNAQHRLTIAGNFISNAFTKDQYIFGVEYCWNNMLQIRGGYNYETDLTNEETNKTAFTGINIGASIIAPLNKAKKSNFSIDYAYKSTRYFSGCHTIGATITL